MISTVDPCQKLRYARKQPVAVGLHHGARALGYPARKFAQNPRPSADVRGQRLPLLDAHLFDLVKRAPHLLLYKGLQLIDRLRRVAAVGDDAGEVQVVGQARLVAGAQLAAELLCELVVAPHEIHVNAITGGGFDVIHLYPHVNRAARKPLSDDSLQFGLQRAYHARRAGAYLEVAVVEAADLDLHRVAPL